MWIFSFASKMKHGTMYLPGLFYFILLMKYHDVIYLGVTVSYVSGNSIYVQKWIHRSCGSEKHINTGAYNVRNRPPYC